MTDARTGAAALWMLGAMLMIGVIDNFIVVFSESISVWQLYVLRMVVAVPVIGLWARTVGMRFAPRRWGAVSLRSFLIAGAMLFYFISLGFLPIAQALAGLFTSPIIVVVITALFLREKIGLVRVGAVLAGFVGTLLVLQVSVANFSLASLFPVLGGILYAIAAVITRRMCDGESTHTLLAGTMAAQGVLGLIGALALVVFQVDEAGGALAFVTRGWVWQPQGITLLLAIHIFGSILGVFALTKAYQLGEASYVAIFEYSIMIFGPLFAFYWFGQGLAPLQMLGIFIIMASGALIALRSKAA